jgi:hypothetical protein
MSVYVLNTLIIPVDFEKHPKVKAIIRKATVEEVRRLLSNESFISAVGHEATSTLLTQLLGINVPYNRVAIKVRPGDVCVHFVLRTRIPEGRILSYEELKQLEFDLAISEIEEVTEK